VGVTFWLLSDSCANTVLNVMVIVIFPYLCFLKIYRVEGIRGTEMAAITGILTLRVFVGVTGM
jgi:hypothetical protein